MGDLIRSNLDRMVQSVVHAVSVRPPGAPTDTAARRHEATTMRSRALLSTTALFFGLAAAQAAPDPAELMKQHRGGTLKLTAHGSAGTIDPAINYTVEFAQIMWITHDGLLTFKKVAGKESNEVVPDLAEAVPAAQDGGKTYVFKLRKGITFSNGHEPPDKPGCRLLL